MQKLASYFQKSESSQKTEARKIEEDSRHLGPIIARAAKIASGTNGAVAVASARFAPAFAVLRRGER